MATPLTADRLLEALGRFGIPYREYPGWRDRGIARARQNGFSPRGISIHHTAGGLGSRTVEQYIRDILVSDPLVPDKCNVAVAPDGTLWLVAAGRANHHLNYSVAGMARIATGTMPLSGSVALRGSVQNFNASAYGVECIAAGVPNAAQRRTAVLWAAAICWAHGWDGGSITGHGEIAYDRDWSDPGFDMGTFRADVDAVLNGSWGRPSADPAPPAQKEEDMPGINTANDPNGTTWALWDDGASCELQNATEVNAITEYKKALTGSGSILGNDLGLVAALRFRADGRWPVYAMQAAQQDTSQIVAMLKSLPEGVVAEIRDALGRGVGAGQAGE